MDDLEVIWPLFVKKILFWMCFWLKFSCKKLGKIGLKWVKRLCYQTFLLKVFIIKDDGLNDQELSWRSWLGIYILYIFIQAKLTPIESQRRTKLNKLFSSTMPFKANKYFTIQILWNAQIFKFLKLWISTISNF